MHALPVRCLIVPLLALAGYPQLARTQGPPRLETGGRPTMPLEWIDEDTGHRIVRLTRREGANRSFYFHNNPFIAGRDGQADRLVYYGSTLSGSQLFVLDLRTHASEQLTTESRRISGEILDPARRQVFYQSRDTVFATHVDSRATRVVFVYPAGYDGAVATVNADGTLLAGVKSTPEKRAVSQANPGRTFDAIFDARLPHTIFTIDVATGKLTEVHEERAWLNHLQFSPADPKLLMFCHEGPWHKLDRIWTIDLDTRVVTKRHERTVEREIAGHEFWSRDGRTIWYDLQVPRGETFFLAGADVATGAKTRYALSRDEWSIHFNISPDQRLFAGDGGDSSQVAEAKDGMWLYLFRPAGDRLVSERLVNMRHHDYELEPNVHFSPDGQWVIFRANFEGESQVYAVSVERAQEPAGPLDWPAITSAQRPWTRWWWQGSAVTEQGLTTSLEAYRAAGLGGVEITPIYGVAGSEAQFLDYLSPGWVQRLEHTLREAARLGLGVDLATGTGWPFGGPHVTAAAGAQYVAQQTYRLRGGERLAEAIRREQEPILRTIGNRLKLPLDSATQPLQRAGRERLAMGDVRDPISANQNLQALALEQVRFPRPMPLQALVGYSAAGELHDLTGRVDSAGRLDWTAPAGDWTLYALFQGWHGKLVERAAPGGEGLALDHFSASAVHDYLAHFSSAFAGHDVGGLRAFFNDSYEVDDAQGEADWTSELFDEFVRRRGYDLRAHLPALFGVGDTATSARVLTDYRETISDLLFDHFTTQWHDWAGGQGALVRNQAHGAPGNLLDLYGASDIPETEGTSILRYKSASSAAHVTGKPLASAEAVTWLNEHFLSSLADVKQAVDGFLLGGINHIVYHGTAYSPEEAPWPGWLFYAAVHFQPTNPLWTDFRTLNDYVARAQSILQHGQPANDVLLYLPVFDRWAERGRSLLVHFDGSMTPFADMTVADDANLLHTRGFAFDFISDRQLRPATDSAGLVRTGGVGYRVVVVPAARTMPLATLEKLIDLARGGATVIFHRSLPAAVPGLANLAERQAAFRAALGQLRFPAGGAGVQRAAVGGGVVLLGDSLELLLETAGVRRERLVDAGLEVVRRSRPDGVDHFIVNDTSDVVDGWVPLAGSFAAAALFDPMIGETGVAKLRTNAQGDTEVRLQLDPGESIIIRSYPQHLTGQPYGYYEQAGAAQQLAGPWRIEFVAGGPQLPPALQAERLASWTEIGGESAAAFSGTASYTIPFSRPGGSAPHWRLELGAVHESARVRLNGKDLGTLIGPTYTLTFPAAQLQEQNELEVLVSNLMANRIAAMDRQQVPWKRFYNVNFPPNQRANAGGDGLFDASRWEPRPSGLLGPLTLTPLMTF